MTRTRSQTTGSSSDDGDACGSNVLTSSLPSGIADNVLTTSVTTASGNNIPTSITSTPIVMTDQHLAQLMQMIRSSTPPASVLPPALSGNFAKCTARFDGAKDNDVVAFIDAIEIYKECVGIEDPIALRGLPMLLNGLAATWWQGVKATVRNWDEAIRLLRDTYGPRLPPHRIYRELFKREQGEESTDVFVSRARALIAQLPVGTLNESVQLDMIYGLLSKRIREKVSRSSIASFADLLRETRRLEDLFDESHTTSHATVQRSSTEARQPFTTEVASGTLPKKPRSHCVYCKKYGHLIDDCPKIKRKKTILEEKNEKEDSFTPQAITCFGCGAPGVLRSKCLTCKDHGSSSFQSVAAESLELNESRCRPVLSVKILGSFGRVLVDTGAKQSIASISLRAHLAKNGQSFNNVLYDLKFADGVVRKELVETTIVNVEVNGLVVPTSFIVLPKATESLLGINFIRDAGMVLNFNTNFWSLGCRPELKFNLDFEEVGKNFKIGTVNALCANKGSQLTPVQRENLADCLTKNQNVFASGGGPGEPTKYAVHHIDTGDSAPIAVPPYRLTPAEKELVRREIDKMLPVAEEVKSYDSYLQQFVNIIDAVKSHIINQQQRRKEVADRSRRPGTFYKPGDLVLVQSHKLSNSSKGFTAKFAPRREGPYTIEKILSPTTYNIQGLGKYHASALTPYTGTSESITPVRKRGRKPKANAKPLSGRSSDLEGETVAPRIFKVATQPLTSARYGLRAQPARSKMFDDYETF